MLHSQFFHFVRVSVVRALVVALSIFERDNPHPVPTAPARVSHL
jgi:hypothetical protein